MSRSYQNFDLIIERVRDIGNNHYRVRVDAPTGKCTVDFAIPFSLGDLDKFVSHIGLLDLKIVKRFGERLFKALFTDKVLSVFSSSLYEAKNQSESHGLRIRLLLTGVPELADIPWEYLYNPASDRFLSLSTHTPIVRYLDLSEINPPFKVKLPLRILVMTSNPYDYPALNVEQEWENLQESLNPLQEKGVVEVVRMERATLDELLQHLRKNDYHVFHFIGHGTFDYHSEDGFLMFENKQKKAYPVSGERLGVILHDEKLRMAVLNACEAGRGSQTNSFAGVGQSLIRQGVSAVIAMQFSISDKAALIFSHKFYQAVTDGYVVDAALAQARKAIFAQEKKVEWGTPVLYSSVSNQPIFDIDSPDSATSPPSDEDQSLQDKIIAYLNEARDKIKHNEKEENEQEEGKAEQINEKSPLTLRLEPNDPELIVPFPKMADQDLGVAFYNRGKKQFNDGNWTAAAVALRHIPEQDSHYQSAKELITTIEAQRPRKRKKPSHKPIIELQHIFGLVVTLFFMLSAVVLTKESGFIQYIDSEAMRNDLPSIEFPTSTQTPPLPVATQTPVTETSSLLTHTPIPTATEKFPTAGLQPNTINTPVLPVASESTATISVTNKPVVTGSLDNSITKTPTVPVGNRPSKTPSVMNSTLTTPSASATFTLTPTPTTINIPTATLTPTPIPTKIPTITFTLTPTPHTNRSLGNTDDITVTRTVITPPTDAATPVIIVSSTAVRPTVMTVLPTETVIDTSTEIPTTDNEDTVIPMGTGSSAEINSTDSSDKTDSTSNSIGNKEASSTPEPTE